MPAGALPGWEVAAPLQHPRVTVWDHGVPTGRSPSTVGPLSPGGTPQCPRDTEDPAWEGSRASGTATALD